MTMKRRVPVEPEDFEEPEDACIWGEAESPPWFLGDPPSFEEEIDDAQWRRELEAIPFVQRCRALHRFVGEGRRLTDSALLPNAAVRELKLQAGISRPGARLVEIPELLGPWNVLVSLGALVVDARAKRVRAVPSPALCDGEGAADASRSVPVGGFGGRSGPDAVPDVELGSEIGGAVAIAELLHGLTGRCRIHGGFADPFLALESLLAATCAGGLDLPRVPFDQEPDEADVARLFAEIGGIPRIHDLPLDEEAGLVDIQALNELVDARSDLGLLSDYGVVAREGRAFVAPRPVRTAVALLLMLES